MAETFQIVDGPGQWDMALAVFEPGKGVEFSLRGRDPLLRRAFVSVTEVDLHFDPASKSEISILGQSDSAALAPGAGAKALFKAHYNLATRQGELTLTATM